MGVGSVGRSVSKTRHVTRLHQMLRRWRMRALFSSSSNQAPPPPPDVPKGHVAVCVGSSSRRYIVRAANLNHPALRELLAKAEEEHGFARDGPLSIPSVDESVFEDVLRHISTSTSSSSSARRKNLEDLKALSCCGRNSGRRRALKADSLPLLSSFEEKSVR